MDDNAKQFSSYQLDQEILDASGIPMTVEEVATLSTHRYSERVQQLNLSNEHLAFLKGLRRRIKNRMASQNSRRRSMEHLKRLSRELRAVRACRHDALAERAALNSQRDRIHNTCVQLRLYVHKVLQERHDTTPVPSIEIDLESQPKEIIKKITVTETKTPLISECFKEKDRHIPNNTKEKDKVIQRAKNIDNIFECRLDKLVQKSVNHIYKEKKVIAKTVFISNEKMTMDDYGNEDFISNDKMSMVGNEDGVLNLSVKRERRSHGRKQSAPRRITYFRVDNDDGVLDLKIKKEQ